MSIGPALIENSVELEAPVRRVVREELERLGQIDPFAALPAEWETRRAISTAMLQRVPVSVSELERYQTSLGGQHDERLLQLVLQAHKAATRLKQATPLAERQAAIAAVIAALHSAVAALGLELPPELEAVVGD
ncbi:MAG: hypothetical protein RMK99_14420 [Anaerolineales bacterium]|nr:hypothetical protein [Anaerolineales bacterium]